MVVHNLYVFSPFSGPAKPNAKLIVYSNAVLPLTLSRESLQPIADCPMVHQETSMFAAVKLRQLACSDLSNPRKLPGFSSLEQCLRVRATEASDHALRVYRQALNNKPL